MFTPGTYNITVLQDATWKKFVRLTQERQALSGVSIEDGVPTFERACHGLIAGDRVVFTSQSSVKPLCGLDLNRIYFVISDSLSTNEFQVSTENDGPALIVDGSLTDELFYAKPISLTSYSVDSDIVTYDSSVQVATFTASVSDAEGGGFELDLQPEATKNMIPGKYKYDVTLISPDGERYYCLVGTLTLQTTFSRA
jgi:hypothetical protein